MKINDKKDFTSTLNLPKKSILMDGNLTKRESYFLDKMQDSKKYKEIVNINTLNGAKRYRMLELPIYVEDRVNPTMIINKVLKDIVIRRKFLNGDVIDHDFIFTNTGDINVCRENQDKTNDILKTRILSKNKFGEIIKNQVFEINSLGTLLDYEKHSTTTAMPNFENSMLDNFLTMYSSGKIHKELRPVTWCTKCGASYTKDEVSFKKSMVDNIYIKYGIKDDKDVLKKYNNLKNTFFLTSTIRPWVMGSCKHLAIAKNLRYDLVEVKDKDKIIHYIIAEECSDIVMQSAFYIKYNVKETFDAIDLIDFVCFNPLDYNKTVDVISSENEYIMYDKKNNTGINIVSSGHTYFDYLILQKEHNDELHTIVDEDGKLNSQSLVYTGDNYLEANTKIVGFLKEFDFIFSTISIKTNIQKCRMCNETLIYRTLNEWYMTKIQGDKLNDITVNNIKSKLISYDEYLNSELDATVTKVNNIVESAISDEKVLGTPIPVFYCADCGKVVLNDVTINILKHLFSTKGSDMWYKMAPEEILRGQASCVCGCGFLFKENSTINDFFKMFCMSFNTKDRSICIENKEIFNDKLKALSFTQNPEKEFENVEQIVIHSSVYEDTKTIAKPLFFIKDDVEDRNELMKKEIGIHDIVKKYGTDVLRLWVLSVSNNKKIKLNEQSIIQTNKIYNNIRKTFKYLMSNVYDFNPFKDNVKVSDRTDLDKYMFVKLRSFSKVINAYFDKFDFKNVYTELVRFCTQDLCKTYFEMIKYDLYILNANDKQRRSIQSTMYDILYTLLLISEPILPFTVEEIWPLIWHKTTDEEKNTLLFKYQLPIVANTYEEETKKYNNIIFIKNNLNKYIRKAIEDKVISNSMQAKVVITTNDNTRLFIEANYEEIIRATNISSIDAKTMLVHKIIVIKEPGDKCARCGRNNISIGVDLKYRYLCPNCVKILNKK